MAAHIRKAIQAAFRPLSLQLDREAMDLLAGYVEESGSLAELHSVMDALDNDSLGKTSQSNGNKAVPQAQPDPALSSLASCLQGLVQTAHLVL